MLQKVIVVAALVLFPALAGAQVRGPWEITVGANGATPNKLNGVTVGGNGSIGYFVLGDILELSVRQSVNYTDLGPVTYTASTRLAVDAHLPLGDQNQFLPFIGANIGYVYGKGVRDTFEAAPEAGIKVFVGPDVFLQFEIEYQFFFKSGGQADSAFKNGEFVYGLNIGFRF